MSSEPKAIADTGYYRITQGGELQERRVREWHRFLYMLPAQDFAALLADLYRRVREEIESRTEMLSDEARTLGERIAEEVGHRLQSYGTLTERMDDLEQLGGDYTSLDGRISTLADRLAAVDKRQETQRLILDSARIAMDMGNKEFRSLADRVSALEQEPFVEHGRWLSLEGRVADLEKSLGGAQSVRERSRFLDEFRDALEARQQDEAPSGNKCWTQCGCEEGAGEGGGEDPALWVDEFERRNGERIRRELAREIVEKLRERAPESKILYDAVVVDPELVAEWIEQEYCRKGIVE